MAHDDPSNSDPRHTGLATLARSLREEARRLGFVRCGIAPVDSSCHQDALADWVARGYAGQMRYMEQTCAQRAHPRTLLPNARSAVVVAASYARHDDSSAGNTSDAANFAAGPQGRIARYARATDYHRVLRERLARLASWLEQRAACQTRIAVDTAPLLERELAMAAGIGFIGKNTMLISPGVGSYTLLGVLLCSLDLPTNTPETARCGRCRACLDSCPTGAFAAPYVLDARRCISYLTIEHRGDIEPELAHAMGSWVFGCDDCQTVCPYNRPTRQMRSQRPDPDLAPPDATGTMSLLSLIELRSGEYRRLVKGKALARVPRHCLVRNGAIAAANGHAHPGRKETGADQAAARTLDAALDRATANARKEVRATIAWSAVRRQRRRE